MIETMIEQVQNLHLAVHNEELELHEIEDKYDCRLTTLNLKGIKEKLLLKHHNMMVSAYGMFNAEDL